MGIKTFQVKCAGLKTFQVECVGLGHGLTNYHVTFDFSMNTDQNITQDDIDRRAIIEAKRETACQFVRIFEINEQKG